MADFNACVEYVLGHEGGYSDDKKDAGGATNFGISLRFLQEVNKGTLKRIGITDTRTPTKQTIKELTKEQAVSLYYSEFWNQTRFDKIMNTIIAKYIFDMSVNHGLQQATKNVQRACWAAQKKKDFLIDDGLLGPKTLGAVNQISFSLIPAMMAERAGFYRRLVIRKPDQEKFLDGWLERAYDLG
jgi:lysozyme family protein